LKNQFLLLANTLNILPLLIFLFLISSCSKEKNCEQNYIGTYSGTCVSNSGTSEGTMNIIQPPTGDKELFIEDGVFHVSGYSGIISADCSSITITNQQVTDINGGNFSVSGILLINDTTITGNLTFDDGSDGIICSYHLMKI